MKIKVGDTVKITMPGLINYDKTGQVVAIAGLDELTGATGSPITPDEMYKVSFGEFEISYSEKCLQKVARWRSIDDE